MEESRRGLKINKISVTFGQKLKAILVPDDKEQTY